MWGVNHDYTGTTNNQAGRQSFGALFQPRLSWKNQPIDIGEAPYPMSGWIVDAPLTVTNEVVGAISLGCFLNTTEHREAKITIGSWAARLRFVEWLPGAENGFPEFRTFATTETVNYLVLELLYDGVVSQSRILHSATSGVATLMCGFVYVDDAFRFVAWASATVARLFSLGASLQGLQASFGCCTAVVATPIDGEPNLPSLQKTVEGSPSLQIVCAAEHFGLLLDTYNAIPETAQTIIDRNNGPPGSWRHRQENALVPVQSLQRFDCGQMVELTRFNAESRFLVHSLAAYEHSEYMPWLPITQASNIHELAEVNTRLQRLYVTSATDGPYAFGNAICTNEGSGLNEYRGVFQGDAKTSSFLIALRRADVLLTSGSNNPLTPSPRYAIRIAYAVRTPNASDQRGFFQQQLTSEQQELLFGGNAAISVGVFQITAIGPA